jgi:hypothetical protein
MKALAAGVAIFLIVPMTLLNPLGRDAFVGYYTGIIAMWAAVVLTARSARL